MTELRWKKFKLATIGAYRARSNGADGCVSVIKATMNNSTPKLTALHPGDVLRDEFLVPMHLTAGAVARHCRIPRGRIDGIIAGRNGVSADTALRLGAAFGTTPEFWLNHRRRYELETVKANIEDELTAITVLA